MAAATHLKQTTKRELRDFRFYESLVHIFVVVLLVSNLVAQKLVKLGPFTLSGAQLLFPITYIFGDVFTEVYGYAGSRRAIWVGFGSSALLAVMGMITVALPPHPDWHNQEAFAIVFGFVPRIVVASLIAYWAGEFANSFVLAKMKILTNGQWLWTRTIGSTVVGEAIDSVLFYPLAFYGIFSNELLVTVMVTNYLLKTGWEVLMTPVTYKVVAFLKRKENEDYYDVGTDFTPFSLKT